MIQAWSGFCLMVACRENCPSENTMPPSRCLDITHFWDWLAPFDEDSGFGFDIQVDDHALPCLLAYHTDETALKGLSETLSQHLKGAGFEAIIRLDPVKSKDWVREVQSRLSPVSVGPFFIHGSHDRAQRPLSRIGLEIDAGQAFGTGYHETTKACLQALIEHKREKRPRSVLDFGCGSGVLGLATMKLLRCPVYFIDIDPVAIDVSRINARINGLRWRGKMKTSALPRTGTRDIQRHDLILANILAKPLVRLAPALCKSLRPSGKIVLAGILASQGKRVISAYRTHGLKLVKKAYDGEWMSCVMKKHS